MCIHHNNLGILSRFTIAAIGDKIVQTLYCHDFRITCILPKNECVTCLISCCKMHHLKRPLVLMKSTVNNGVHSCYSQRDPLGTTMLPIVVITMFLYVNFIVACKSLLTTVVYIGHKFKIKPPKHA